jgi:hypothetical protein
MKRKGKSFPSLFGHKLIISLFLLPCYIIPQFRLELNHRLQSTILEPRHTEIIVEKLANVHSQGRRSRVLDVGAVSVFLYYDDLTLTVQQGTGWFTCHILYDHLISRCFCFRSGECSAVCRYHCY